MCRTLAWVAYAIAVLFVDAQYPPSWHVRGPPGNSTNNPSSNGYNNAAGNCAALKSVTYPNRPGIVYSATFVVPPLPQVLDVSRMTWYDYFNIYWARDMPSGSKFNQFVPQLMLGNALCHSSNANKSTSGKTYQPASEKLSTWHFGAQYFFALCPTGSCQTFESHAAVGKLVAVEPGEKVLTWFSLSADWVWTLGMKIDGGAGGSDRESVITVDQPFMGMLPSTRSWSESRYVQTVVGSCTELYNMKPGSVPMHFEVDMTVESDRPEHFWSDWQMRSQAQAPWAPAGSVSSEVSPGKEKQMAQLKISPKRMENVVVV